MRTLNRKTLVAAMAVFLMASCAYAQNSDPPAYLNPSLPPGQRAADLVHRMTVEEKVTQLTNQSRAIERLHIPAYNWWSEALHGVASSGTTEFPEPVGLASTFDTDAIHRMAIAIGTEARVKRAQFERAGHSRAQEGLDFWAPNINIFRDPRWGRGQETYGEDPFLSARLGVAFVTGMQGDDPKYYRVISTPKHYAVHSGPEPTRHTADVKVSKHDELDTYLPAFRTKLFGGALLAIAAGLAPELAAQLQTDVPPPVAGAKPVTVEHIKVHGAALEGNLEGDAVDRDVFVFLPPSYAQDKSRRYPVVYALHGYSIGAEQWTHEIHVPQTIEGAFAQGAKEMIVVLPDSKTLHSGSMYSSSVTTGDFEQFIAHDLVSYIDAHYRTIPDRQSRGLVGHSMGGYGATRIGMKHSDVFGSLYIMSPCCLSPRSAVNSEVAKSLEAVKAPADSASLPFFARATLASAAAWSPNPKNPPLYLDLPTKEGAPQQDVLAKWAANAPLAFIDQYIANLRQYRRIAIDVGDQDGLRVDTAKLHEVLDKYGMTNSFEVYSGTHISKVADRFQNHVLPFFSQNLCFQPSRQ